MCTIRAKIALISRSCSVLGRPGLLWNESTPAVITFCRVPPPQQQLQWKNLLSAPSLQKGFFSTTSNNTETKNNDQQEEDGTSSRKEDSASATAACTNETLLYESPLKHVVTRLRAVSFLSAVTGSVGLPLFCALKGIGDAPTGILAFGMTFVAGSCASTAAIHYIFSPYVYSIHQIPIRQCHSQREEDSSEQASAKIESTTAATDKPKDVLLKAVSRSLILTRVETVFDPATDVIPYKGLRPLCNFVVTKGHGERPLYVHPEYVYNAALRKQLQLPELPRMDNPDDELL